MQAQTPDSDLIRFMVHCRRSGLTPAQAMNRWLVLHNQSSLVPKWSRPFVKDYLKDIIALFDYLASPEGAAWMREQRNLENLFRYIAELLR